MRKGKNPKKERINSGKEAEKEGRFDEEPEEERRTRDEDAEEKE
jgi:hypothetical protein